MFANCLVLFNQWFFKRFRTGANKLNMLTLGLDDLSSLIFFFLCDFINQIFTHFSICCPFTSHKAQKSWTWLFNDMISSNVLGAFCLGSHNKRPQARPSWNFHVNESLRGNFFHNLPQTFLNKFSLFYRYSRVSFRFLEFPLSGSHNNFPKPRNHQQNPAVRRRQT